MEEMEGKWREGDRSKRWAILPLPPQSLMKPAAPLRSKCQMSQEGRESGNNTAQLITLRPQGRDKEEH